MSGFFSKLFGGAEKKDGKKKESGAVSNGARTQGSTEGGSSVDFVHEIMNGLIERAQLDLTFDVKSEMNGPTEEITIEVSGTDEGLVTEKEGALLDAFQLFVKRVLQHQLPDSHVNVTFDSNGFREESSKELVELAEKLKEKCLEQGRSVYLRALPPKDRKIVHQHLANDERVRSRSVGDGLYKKVKIYPVKAADREQDQAGRETPHGAHEEADDNFGNV